jgi:CubicO group peptidase (beta-lactamase class C family)
MARTRFSQTGLVSNQFLMTAELVPGRVTTYEWMRDHQQAYRALYMKYTFAAGGAFSSIADMAAFAQGVGGGALLGKDLRETMWKPAPLSNGKSAGFGVGFTIGAFRGQREIGHAGGPALADVAFYPEQDLAVVVLTNQRALIPYLARGVAAGYLPAPGWLNEAGMADRDPARTANFKAALVAVASGRDPVAAFAAGSEKSAEEFSDWFAIPLGSYPPLSRLVLLKDEDGKSRSYRAHFGDKMSQRFNAKFADDARLLSIAPVDE